MNEAKVKKAVAEAFRFLEAAKTWEKSCDKNIADLKEHHAKYGPSLDQEEAKRRYSRDYNTSPAPSGALKRASMDLTRSLSDLRKPG